MNKNILSQTLITGANGMIGSYIDFGIKTDRRLLNITDLDEVLAVTKTYNPRIILHLAAETNVKKCERNPEHAYLVNGVGTYNMAVAAKTLDAKLVYISTAGVFEGTKTTPYTKKDEPNPQNYYGRSKYLGELIVKGMLKNYIIGRVGWVFGGGPQKDRKFVAKIIKQLNKPKIRVVNDKIGSPIYAKDLVNSIKALIKQEKTGIFHLSNKGVCSRYDIAKVIVNTLKSNVKIIPVDSSYFNLDTKSGKSEAIVSNISTIRTWQEALQEYLEMEWKSFLKF